MGLAMPGHQGEQPQSWLWHGALQLLWAQSDQAPEAHDFGLMLVKKAIEHECIIIESYLLEIVGDEVHPFEEIIGGGSHFRPERGVGIEGTPPSCEEANEQVRLMCDAGMPFRVGGFRLGDQSVAKVEQPIHIGGGELAGGTVEVFVDGAGGHNARNILQPDAWAISMFLSNR